MKHKHYLEEIFYTELADIVGKKNVLRSDADKLTYSNDIFWISEMWVDRKQKPPTPDFIVQPKNVKEIQQILKLANRDKIPVTPWGGGSGSQGGVAPIYDGITMDLKYLNKLIEINENSLTATVETGINQALFEKKLNKHGFTMPHYPASANCATLGGFIAHRGSGTFSTKYGKIEDMVLELEVVLPTGKIFKTLPVPKHASGPGLHEMFIGSEGSFGIVTKATVQIERLPEERRFSAYLFNNLEDGIEAGKRMMLERIRPAAIRLYGPEETKTKQGDVLDIEFENEAYMVLAYDGDPELIDYKENKVKKICEDLNGDYLGRESGEKWWESRYDFYYPPYDFRLPLMYGTMDTCCKFDDILKIYNEKKETLEKEYSEWGLSYIAHFSHWYDWGMMIYDRFIIEEPPKDPKKAIRLHNEIWNKSVRISIKNGGVINEHHGVGLKLARFMPEQYGCSFEFLEDLKNMVDPNKILNPGKTGFGPSN